MRRPRDQRHDGLAELVTERCQRIAVTAEADQKAVAEFLQPLIEHRRTRSPAGLLKRAECERTCAKLPQDPQRPAPTEQVEQRHNRPAGGRSPYAPAWPGRCHLLSFRQRCYINSSTRLLLKQ